MNIAKRLTQYAQVKLTADLTPLTDKERAIIPLLLDAAQAMDEAFWLQNYGDPDPLLAATADPDTYHYIQLNYGPWDNLQDDEPFIAGIAAKPPGASFYPPDIRQQELEASASANPELASMYTMVRRTSDGALAAIPYHHFFQKQVQLAADKLHQAAEMIEQTGLKNYLTARADALLSNAYQASDIAWMEMKDNTLDILVGPIETSADRLYGQKAAYAATILIKDQAWSQRLSHYTQLLADFQAQLPVPAIYKREQPGLASDLYVYDVLYCAGYDNTSIPLGISLPDDNDVRQRMGSRSLQLKNTMRAKFEKLVLPKVELLIANEQRPSVTFDAYFNFVLFHEIAHGLGIRQTITGKGTVKQALKDLDHPIEESKANLVGLLVMIYLHQRGEISEADLHEVYITSLGHLFRLWEGRQALLQINFFQEIGAYSRDPDTQTYRVHMELMETAVRTLAEKILRLQGDGDYDAAKLLLERYGKADDDLTADMQRFEATGNALEIALIQNELRPYEGK